MESAHECNVSNAKIFNDPIHGHISLPPLLIRIIDTPEFQRLRYIKQLGGGYYVFPGASHNRFEHSIGVAHLAGCFAETLKNNQPELGIDDRDVLCVKIAGLCHDLGHGAFSHLFDMKFMKKVRPERKFVHEEASIKLFDYLIEKNNLVQDFEKSGLQLPDDTDFIKQLIIGYSDSETAYKGRAEKTFLYEIVANKTTGIDVDKWDYFARDCHHLGINSSFDTKRFLTFAWVCEVDNRKQICIRDKEVDDLYEMFHTRYNLHRRAYQHKVVKVIEEMITDALIIANNHMEGYFGKKIAISETVDDMEAFVKVTDYILNYILNSTDENLSPAREILERLQRRQLFPYVGQKRLKHDITDIDEDSICRKIAAKCNGDPRLEDIAVNVITIDYGMKDKDPIDNMRFYKKGSAEATKLSKSKIIQLLPKHFRQRFIYVFIKKRNPESMAAVTKALNELYPEDDPAVLEEN